MNCDEQFVFLPINNALVFQSNNELKCTVSITGKAITFPTLTHLIEYHAKNIKCSSQLFVL